MQAWNRFNGTETVQSKLKNIKNSFHYGTGFSLREEEAVHINVRDTNRKEELCIKRKDKNACCFYTLQKFGFAL